jgi:hypothetical protein
VISNDASAVQNHFTEKKFLAVDSNFLEVFDYAVKEGNAGTCFLQPRNFDRTYRNNRKKIFRQYKRDGQKAW